MEKILLSICCIAISYSLSAQSAVSQTTTFASPEFGFVSEAPAPNWEHSLLSGNGTMGLMMPGNPYDERLYLSHAAIYLPQETSEVRFLQAKYLDEIRRLCLDGKYREAGDMIDTIRKETGWKPTIFMDNNRMVGRDPFLPAFTVHIRQENGATKRYQRRVNFPTGEVLTEWQTDKGYFCRSAFVSRPDSVIVIRLSGDAPINAVLAFEELPIINAEGQIMRDKYIKESRAGIDDDGRLTWRTLFSHTNPYNPLCGYEGAGRLIHRGGQLHSVGNEIIAHDVNELLLFIRILPLPLGTEQRTDELNGSLDSLPPDYNQVLASHSRVHGELFNRVSLDLHADPAERALSSEQLLKRSQQGDVPLAMVERAFNAGRYNIISCMGYNPPNLIGIWSGTWLSPWAGSFTADGNLHSAISSALACNTPELMFAFFNMVERMMPGFRTNARELFGMRGFNVPVQTTTVWAVTDNFINFPLSYWTAGAAWYAQWYYDYYDYTGDRSFLRNTAYPLMKEAATFYEDFLTVERNGKYVFVPSYSPENYPGSTKMPSCINATMDMAACRQLLRNCIAAATILKTDNESVKRWKTMLTKLPDYDIAPDGALREWLWPGLTNQPHHRHCSHLYGLFDELPEEFKHNPVLRKAAEVAIDRRIHFFKEINSEMAFGLCQAGWAAAHIGCSRQTTEIIDFMLSNYWSTGMASFHDAHRLFNMDISGGYPYLVSQCLALSAVETVHAPSLQLLPALPARWTQGSIEGLRLRGNIILRRLEWNEGRVEATLVAPYSGKLKVECKGIVKTVSLVKGKEVSIIFEQ